MNRKDAEKVIEELQKSQFITSEKYIETKSYVITKKEVRLQNKEYRKWVTA